MLETKHLLFPTSFPPLHRESLQTLQVNLGYVCNQSCRHCHVAAGPARTERMDLGTAQQVLDFARLAGVGCLDLTGGAPELNPHFRWMVGRARAAGLRVVDRCNLTVLLEPGHERLPAFFADQGVEVVASLPCYLQENVDQQRGAGVFEASIEGLRRLNACGYGIQPRLSLDLVYNPQGPSLPPAQAALEADYRRHLGERYGVRFTRLLTLANMPIKRFGSALLSRGGFQAYMDLLRSAHRAENLGAVMCRRLLSVDWRGYVYDCDFNQMLGIPIGDRDGPLHISSLVPERLRHRPIRVGEHCYGCTAGQGSSCGGALAG